MLPNFHDFTYEVVYRKLPKSFAFISYRFPSTASVVSFVVFVNIVMYLSVL